MKKNSIVYVVAILLVLGIFGISVISQIMLSEELLLDVDFLLIAMAVTGALLVFILSFPFIVSSKKYKEIYIEIFTSPGCAYCPAVKKALEEVSNELKGDIDITIEEVDITIDPMRAAQYDIMSVPAVAINGTLKFIGLVNKAELKKAIAEELKT